MDQITFSEINKAKTNLDDIYNQPDPRAYCGRLGKLDYVIPDVAKPIFRKVISEVRQRRRDVVHVLDLGCSYGINAALLKYDLTMPELYDHWEEKRLARASPEEVAELDREYFASLDEVEKIKVIGLDQAENAIEYGHQVGLLDAGHAVNLEAGPLAKQVKEDLSAVDLVVSTGCVGYVTEKTFERLLPAVTQGRPPWMANFVLRLFPFNQIEETLNKSGYVTEKLEGHTFVQRRFESDGERESMLEQLRKQGIDPTAAETEGHLLAEFYLSRPAGEMADAPIEQVVLA
ncbi:MAG: class I SAM-dependent methyltransferase [Xanthobacteraceae bacterium]